MRLPARRARDAAAVVFVAIALLPVSAQDPSSSDQVFRSAVDFVRVDAYPRRDGRIIEGLTAADFTLLEDGQPQAIDTFEFVRHSADPAWERVDPRNRAEAERWIADPKRRLFVIYIDLYHISRVASHQIRGPLMQVLSESIGPSDVVAVMTSETRIGDLQFTQTLNTVSAEIERYWEWGLEDAPVWPRNPAEEQLAACGNGRSGFSGILKSFRDDVFFTSLESLIAHIGALRQDRTNVILLSEGWRNGRGGINIRNLNNLPGQGQIPIRRQAGRIPSGGGSGIDQFGRPTVDTATVPPRSCAELLARLNVDYDDRFRRLFRTANANNVSFHTIDVGGLRTDAPTGRPRTLQELAENTDGVATINANDVAYGLRRIVDHTSSYYLLGYASTNTATDGGYRRIDVRVNQRGVDVTARRGYTAVSNEVLQLADDRAARAAVPPAVADAFGLLSRWDDNAMGPETTEDDVALELAPPTPLLGQARLFRIPAIGRAAPEPARSPLFRRGERLRLEWRPSSPPPAPSMRLLDRRGQPLSPGAAMAMAFDAEAGILRVELHVAALAEGDYGIEASPGNDDETERQIVAFRVER